MDDMLVELKRDIGLKMVRMVTGLLLSVAMLHAVALAEQKANQNNPRVRIISPINGTSFPKENIIPITYCAWSPDGTVLIRAEAYVDG
ncbi:MAG TPA: hypothetical protein EYP10_13560, partial [Armatimonadetes bacterium]|nr:hypothetical protein [Armatimonadota bacterium]